jgi:hypothetical protein
LRRALAAVTHTWFERLRLALTLPAPPVWDTAGQPSTPCRQGFQGLRVASFRPQLVQLTFDIFVFAELVDLVLQRLFPAVIHQVGLRFHSLDAVLEVVEPRHRVGGIQLADIALGLRLALRVHVPLDQHALFFARRGEFFFKLANVALVLVDQVVALVLLFVQHIRAVLVAALFNQRFARQIFAAFVHRELGFFAPFLRALRNLIRLALDFLRVAIAPAQDALTSTSVSSISRIISLTIFSGSSALSSIELMLALMMSRTRVKIPIALTSGSSPPRAWHGAVDLVC